MTAYFAAVGKLIVFAAAIILCWVLWREWTTYRIRRQAELKARRARMQAAYDRYVCKQLENLPASEDAND